jgi:raffinose/stachyose/melibiose transport system substrate-binding protein
MKSPRTLPRARPKRRRATAILVVAAAVVALSGCAAAGSDDTVTLNFFQFKPEAVGNFTAIIKDFEAENPGIRVIQNSVPDPDTAIRTLLVKDKVPDVLTVNVNGNYGELARACIFADLGANPVAETVNPAVQQIVQSLGTCAADGGKGGAEVNALPFASNASGILYNPDIFRANGVAVPTTWDELVAAADTFQANGVSPFFCTLKDSWTASPAFVNLGGTLMPDGFFDALRAGPTGSAGPVSFAEDFADAADKEVTLFDYCQDNFASRDYNAGNKAFADGESAMYLQGSYAIPAIRANNPDAAIASFPYPVTDDADARVVVSGVDVGIMVGRNTPHAVEAQAFVDYLMSPDVVAAYSEAQSTFSPLKDAAANNDPALAGLEPYFTSGRIIGFLDHQIPAAVPLVNLLQTLVITGDTETFLADLDSEWDKVAARTTTQRQGK